MKKQTSRRRIDVNVEELDRIIDGAMREPLNETDGQTLKTAVHAMAERLVRGRNTEKTSTVLGDQDSAAPTEETRAEASKDKPAGHGRNGASAYRGAERSRLRMRPCSPAIAVRTAGEVMFTNRRNPKPGSAGRHGL